MENLSTTIVDKLLNIGSIVDNVDNVENLSTTIVDKLLNIGSIVDNVENLSTINVDNSL